VIDSLDLSAIARALGSTAFSQNLQHLSSTTSTNILALEAAQSNAPHGSVWVADQQTAGRGRGGHGWHSAAGDGLYVSVLLRLQMALSDALWLSLATGLAAQSAIHTVTGLNADIRWPNDLLIGNKKCGGILVETSAPASHADSPSMLRYAVIGFGLNLNHAEFPTELQTLATSLHLETGRSWSRQTVLVEFLLALQQEIDLLEQELRGDLTSHGLLARFAAASSWVRGKHVHVDESGGYTGVTAGLDARGFLLVTGDNGLPHTVLSGGVRAR
jgi:BirA family biotin operon repressor/biotin-[acetyl-CoA-carboxylase] ligase